MAPQARTVLVAAVALSGALAAAQLPVYNDRTKDFEKLTKGVTAIPRLGTPGNIVVGGPDAFAIVNGNSGGRIHAAVAATRFGKGLALAFGHSAYLSKSGLEAGDTMALVENAVNFGVLQQRKTRIAVYRSKPLAQALTAAGYLVKEFNRANWTTDLKFYDAAVSSSDTLGNGNDFRRLVEYVRNGGTFIGAVTGWGWQQTNVRRNPNLDLAVNMHHNVVLRRMGLAYGRRTIGAYRPIKASEITLSNCQFALQRLIAHRDRKEKLQPNQLFQWSDVLIVAVQNVHPFDNIVRGRLDLVIEYVGSSIVPSEKKPLKVEDPLRRIALFMRFFDSQKISQDEITADAAARTFPGVAPRKAKRVKRDVLIAGDLPGWASTGLWVNAGERITVVVPERLKDKGLRIRIGAHQDQLWRHAEWKRHPSITREFPITEAETKARSEFGGLVYIVLPNGANFRDFQVNIGGAVRAPRFVLGETSLKHWVETERDLPAPWAELQSDRIILTVPADVVRKLDDPDQLMQHWDRVLATYAELSMRPLAKRAQRMVCDVQISAGYMHSGYPIMMHMDQPKNLVSVHKQENGTRDNWGLWHELGHNHQQSDWTFSGAGEVTCNL
ncbi:MAG: hypothetical protein IIC73_02100, partial [Armatimonadetes bacterium]|nr:hypothetical protein [Armatimonadota bacterium]